MSKAFFPRGAKYFVGGLRHHCHPWLRACNRESVFSQPQVMLCHRKKQRSRLKLGMTRMWRKIYGVVSYHVLRSAQVEDVW